MRTSVGARATGKAASKAKSDAPRLLCRLQTETGPQTQAARRAFGAVHGSNPAVGERLAKQRLLTASHVAGGYSVTTAEITPEEKNSTSHRGKAFRAIAPRVALVLET